MPASADLKRRVGDRQYQDMLRHSNPKNEEQWAFVVLRSLQQQEKDRAAIRAKRRQALREIMAILNEHPILGVEDEDRIREWANVITR